MSVILAGFGSFWLVVGRFDWFWLVLGRFGSFWLVLGRFGWFRVLVSTVVLATGCSYIFGFRKSYLS